MTSIIYILYTISDKVLDFQCKKMKECDIRSSKKRKAVISDSFSG